MNRLIIRHKPSRLLVKIPFWVYLDGNPTGYIIDYASIPLYNGTYSVGIWLVLRFRNHQIRFGREERIFMLNSDQELFFFHDEPIWDSIFNIDLFIWIIFLLIDIPTPWNIIYHVLSDGFFLVWIVRLFITRAQYLTFTIKETTV